MGDGLGGGSSSGRHPDQVSLSSEAHGAEVWEGEQSQQPGGQLGGAFGAGGGAAQSLWLCHKQERRGQKERTQPVRKVLCHSPQDFT